MFVGLCNPAYDAAWISCRNDAGGDIPVDDAARPDYRIVSNGDAGQHADIGSEPHIIANLNRQGDF